MIGKKLISEQAMSLAEAQAIIEKRKKEGELSYEQNLTLEYCKKFSKLNKKEVSSLIKELTSLEKVSEKHAIVLVDLLPKNENELRLIFAKEHFILSEGELKNILDVLAKYRK